MSLSEFQKRGYLNENFRFFHLLDEDETQYEYHYHEFDKIIIFFSGNVTYQIEGKYYYLKPWDILLVNHHDIHKPMIKKGQPYERIVIWINDEFMKEYDTDKYRLGCCFELVNKRHSSLVRMDTNDKKTFRYLLTELEISLLKSGFANELLTKTFFIQLMIYLNRLLIDDLALDSSPSIHSDILVDKIIEHINNHIGEDLSIDALSQTFYISSSYLMHKFKKKTGYSLHNYIQKKRLLMSVDLLKQGVPITTACLNCGFTDYSSFLRAFKRMYHCTPSHLINTNKRA